VKAKTMKKRIILLIVLVAFLTVSFSAMNGRRHHGLDRPIQIEEWMTSPFIDSIDEPLVVEDWMTKPFITLS
jgi:hypothetical protein